MLGSFSRNQSCRHDLNVNVSSQFSRYQQKLAFFPPSEMNCIYFDTLNPLLFTGSAAISYSVILGSLHTQSAMQQRQSFYTIQKQTRIIKRAPLIRIIILLTLLRRHSMLQPTRGESQWRGWSSRMSGKNFKTLLLFSICR